METRLTVVAKKLAQTSDRRWFIKLLGRATGGAVLATQLMGGVAHAQCSCPNCSGTPCNGCTFSSCPSGCTPGYSWDCCFNGCIYTCQDCNCNGSTCVCGGYGQGGAPVATAGAAGTTPSYPCYVC